MLLFFVLSARFSAAQKKRRKLKLTNLKFLFCNVNVSLDEWLSDLDFGQLKRVSIQFPDPWFKRKHFKRRVLNTNILNSIAKSMSKRWIEKYDVNGIPQLTFFDDQGEFKGFSLGVRKYSELNEIFLALINNSELPSFTTLSNSSNLISKNNLKVLNNNIRSEGPRDHS